MSVLPRTQLGYTLGIRRDKNIYGQGERRLLETLLRKVEAVLEWQVTDE